MCRRPPVLVLALLWLVAGVGAACGPQPNLTDLKVTPTISGYYDDGLTPAGENRLLPSVTFTLRNDGQIPVTNVDLVVAFWEVGADGENDSKQIRGVGGTPLEPGKEGDAITVRASIGYTSAAPRAEFFSNSYFKGFIVKVFAKRGGKIARLGEYPVDARLLPAARKDSGRP